MSEVIGSFGIVGILFLILLIILWTLLPFAVFGIKERLDAQTQLLREIKNELKSKSLLAKNEDEAPAPKAFEFKHSSQSVTDEQTR